MEQELMNIPVAEYPSHYIAFFIFEVPTQEGPGYVFSAIDAFTDYAFNLGVEAEVTAENVLKHIYFLTEHPEFSTPPDGKTFNLVVEDDYGIPDRIKAIIEPSGGSLLIDSDFTMFLAKPFLDSFAKYFNKGGTFYD